MTTAVDDAQLGVIETKIPSRLDRLPWTRFHWRIVVGLGTAWILDGLEVTIVGSVASRLTEHGSGISITSAGIGEAAAIYVVGACVGALVFGHLTDRFGRRKLFIITLALYMAATALTAVSFSAWFFFLFRFFTGAGIGGEYAAINSAIDELIPARARGRVDLVINGSYWIGSIGGSALAILFLNESIFAADVGWRLTFVLGIILASAVMLVRRHVPESPRWLFIHGHEEQAEALVDQIEADVRQSTGAELEPVERTLTVRQRRTIGFRTIVATAVQRYPKRSILCVALFVGQAFIYNGITFDLGTLMSKFFHVASGITPVFLILYAAANFLGPLLLGRLFDTVGRVPMITGTYLGSALLGLLLAGLFVETGVFDRWTFIVVVMGTFFLASAGASAAYLTASEIFPMETRALSIALYYAIGTAVGGIAGPLLFGPLISTGSRGLVGVAFLIGSVLMAAGAVTELVFGVRAEGMQLEDIATPLTAEEAEEAAPATALDGGGGGGDQRAAEHRARSSDHRAQASEHRARLHAELAGSPEDPGGDGRAEIEDTLAQVSDARALAEDERARASEHRADLHRAGSAGDGHAGAGHAGDAGGQPALLRSVAAGHRARSHEEEALALLAADEAETEAHRRMADAALERARSAEQLALAAEWRGGDRGDGGGGDRGGDEDAAEDAGPAGTRGRQEAEMHATWAEMHAHRARAFELRAGGRHAEANGEERAADTAGDRARQHAFLREAAEHRAAATADREEARRVERERQEAQWQAEVRAQAASDGKRIRARLERRRARETAGIRRYRPGPGRLGTPPGFTLTPPVPEEVLDHEILAIERALSDHGPTERRELSRMVGGELWGPGVFAEVLRRALAEGSIRRLSRRIYASASDRDGPDGEEGA